MSLGSSKVTGKGVPVLYLLMAMIWAVMFRISMTFSILLLLSFSALGEGDPGGQSWVIKNQSEMEEAMALALGTGQVGS